jgi:hypothetical protein
LRIKAATQTVVFCITNSYVNVVSLVPAVVNFALHNRDGFCEGEKEKNKWVDEPKASNFFNSKFWKNWNAIILGLIAGFIFGLIKKWHTQ